MIHLVLHVVSELDICWLVHNRWMYPMERMVKVLKGYVHSMARLEGSMVEGYVLEETLRLVTKYMHAFKHVSRKV
jgi:hypothetical protein